MSISVNSNVSHVVSAKLYKMRHSLAHIMAQAVQEIYPGTKLGFGPAIDDGFYYDFIFTNPITTEDFPKIEKKMKEIIKSNQEFISEDLDYAQALNKIESMGEPYKQEYAKELFEKKNLKSLTFYTNGPFHDMCEGPHVEKTREIPPNCFKLRSIAGAYWRGDSDNVMMTRIYAWAYENKEDLREKMKAHEEALKRDHKKLGAELDLFVFDQTVGKGLPLWTPNGTAIREELENYLKELEFKAGYHRVATPHLAKAELFHQSGHLPYYKEDMFPFMEIDEDKGSSVKDDKEAYCLRPMNCPHHHKIFGSRSRSYRELPLRLAEYGQVYRYEQSGSLSGLLRVRGFCQNDAHIYCSRDQAKDEILSVIKMHEEVYQTFGIEDFYMRLSTWDPEDPKGMEKYIDRPDEWEQSQEILRVAMKESGLPYTEVKGEAAFYGPKVDFQIRSVTGREETASTFQLDFGVPERMGLHFTNSNNAEEVPYVIHRAPAGSHERFIAFLIEHYAGAFPLWIAPVQVKIIVISDKFMPYAKKVHNELRGLMIRAEIDDSSDSFNKKIRTNTKKKIPYLVIIGENEVNEEMVTVRKYGIKEQDQISLNNFLIGIKDKVLSRDSSL